MDSESKKSLDITLLVLRSRRYQGYKALEVVLHKLDGAGRLDLSAFTKELGRIAQEYLGLTGHRHVEVGQG